MEHYPSNSHVSREAKREDRVKQTPSVKGHVKKSSPMSGAVNDILDNIGRYALEEVIKPTLRSSIHNILTTAIDIVIYGEDGGPRRRDSRRSYDSYYDRYDRRGRDRDYDRRERRSHRDRDRDRLTWEDIVYDSRGEAERAIEDMKDIIDRYGKAYVIDLCEVSSVTSDNYMDSRYGWYDFDDARSKPTYDGYRIVVHRPEPIK